MVVEMKMKALCVGKKEETSQDGKTKYYSVAIVQNGEAGKLSCTEDVYNQVAEMTPYDFTCVYRDGQYKGLRVTHAGIVDLNGGGSTPQGTSTEKGKK